MEDREMRVQEGVRERGRKGGSWKKKGSRDGAWQRCELNGHAHIRRGHDSTRRLSPAGSILCAAMLFWLLFSHHTNTHARAHSRAVAHLLTPKMPWIWRGPGSMGGRGPRTNGNAKLVTLTLGDKGTLGCRCSC